MKTGLSHGQHEVLLCEISRTGHFLRENLLSYSLPDWASLECWSALNLDPQSKMSETVKAYLMACIGNLNLMQVGWPVWCQADLAIISSGGIQKMCIIWDIAIWAIFNLPSQNWHVPKILIFTINLSEFRKLKLYCSEEIGIDSAICGLLINQKKRTICINGW